MKLCAPELSYAIFQYRKVLMNMSQMPFHFTVMKDDFQLNPYISINNQEKLPISLYLNWHPFHPLWWYVIVER